MFLARPVAPNDLDALVALAEVATPGVHTLPRSRRTIARVIDHSVASFDAQPDLPGDESYFFVLEAGNGELVGTAAISATAGARGTFFCFRNDVLHQVSRDLNVSHSVHALTLCSDLTACSQLSSFYLRSAGESGSESRSDHGNEAALLSRSRLLFAALQPHRFSEKFFASMAGITDGNGRSPFWEALGRKFFRMDFLQAERMIEGARNRTLIVELMPHYPVYVPLLPGEAQAAMGQVHVEGELPFSLLADEGFEPDQYVDIFDGGPILQAHRKTLRSFAQSRRRTVAAGLVDADAPAHLVATTREEGFRAVVTHFHAPELSDELVLDEATRRRLDVVAGDTVLCVTL